MIASAQGVLTAPSLAVKTKSGQSYVTISKNGQQTDTNVTVGLSDGTSTEIQSGVALGDTLQRINAVKNDNPVFKFGERRYEND